MRRLGVCAALAAVALASPALAADDEDKGKPFGARDALKKEAVPVPWQPVTFPTADGATVAAGYVPAAKAPGGPVLVLVHGEGQTRATWEPLLGRLLEHRVPFLALDLRGHGASATQAGKDLSALARKSDPTLFAAAVEDLRAAVRWLVEVKGHDPQKVGVLATGGLGSAAAIRLASLEKAAVSALMVMTPTLVVPGYDVLADAHGLRGAMPFVILCGAEDWDRPEPKKGPRHLLYAVKYDRDAPKDTPLDERISKRRGIPPRIRSFREPNVPGTKAFETVKHLDAWVAAWWARHFGTYPNAVLYDGYVDTIGDYADPGWAAGTPLPAPEGSKVRVLRWGRRLMIGGELPPDARKVMIRVRWARGQVETGQFADIEYPSGSMDAVPRQKVGRRAAPIETTNLVVQPDSNPREEDAPPPLASFEAEVTLPKLPWTREGDYQLHVSVGVSRAASGQEDATEVDPDRFETWTVVPDLEPPEVETFPDEKEDPPKPPTPPKPSKPPR
jgi:pimeloyl-ACP methyl ester carboxylesterase